MALAKHPIRIKAAAADRRTSQAEELGLHAAIILIALAAVLVRIAG